MPKLPPRQKVTTILFRRVGPDEILVVQREAKGARRLALPSGETLAGESWRDAARRISAGLVRAQPLAQIDLGAGAEYRVSAGPSAGEWTEHFQALEFAFDARASEGVWLPHYDAKAQAGAESPRVREAISRLREAAKLRP